MTFFPNPISWALRAVGAAHMAAIVRPAASCCFSKEPTSFDSARAFAPPRPPGRTMASNGPSDIASVMLMSGRIETARLHLMGEASGRPATVTSTLKMQEQLVKLLMKALKCLQCQLYQC